MCFWTHVQSPKGTCDDAGTLLELRGVEGKGSESSFELGFSPVGKAGMSNEKAAVLGVRWVYISRVLGVLPTDIVGRYGDVQ